MPPYPSSVIVLIHQELSFWICAIQDITEKILSLKILLFLSSHTFYRYNSCNSYNFDSPTLFYVLNGLSSTLFLCGSILDSVLVCSLPFSMYPIFWCNHAPYKYMLYGFLWFLTEIAISRSLPSSCLEIISSQNPHLATVHRKSRTYLICPMVDYSICV